MLLALLLLASGGGCMAGRRGEAETAALSGGPDLEARQVTRGMDDELSPVIDATRQRLFYVSNQGQDREIWMRPLAGGPARRLTNDPADDFDPALSFDGKTLAFASQRLDAKGDIFLLSLADGGNPVRLTDRSAAERQPVFLPDGRLAFTRGREDGGAEGIYLLDPKTRAVRRLTRRDGFDPAVSPDGRFLAFTSPTEAGRPCLWLHDLADGQERPLTECDRPEAFPAFGGAGAPWVVVFSRFQDDTNQDGRIDTADRPSLWRVEVGADGRRGEPFPLTAGLSSDIQPRVAGDRVFYASRTDGGLDIWQVPLAGLGRPIADRRDALARANNAAELQMMLYWLRRAERELGAVGDVELVRVLRGERLLDAGRLTEAVECFASLLDKARLASIRNRARWGLLAAQVERELPPGLTAAQRVQRRAQSEEFLRQLESLPVSPSRRALLRARILERSGRLDEALAALEPLLRDGRGASRLAVRALLQRAALWARAGQPAGAREDALRVLMSSRATPAERRQAADFLTGQALSLPAAADARPVLERLQELARQGADLPDLAGRAGLALGEWYLAEGQEARARAAFLGVLERPDALPELAGRALLLLSRLDRKSGDTGAALERAVDLLRRFPTHPAAAVPARREVEELGRRTLDALIARSDIAAARRLAQRMLEQDEDDPVLWRRWVELMARSGDAAAAVQRCRDFLSRRPGELGHYLVGLSLTYLEPPAHFSEAERQLRQALLLDERFGYAHQTLGWIEEQRGRTAGDGEALGRAAAAYEAALALIDARTQPEAEADLLQNLGNVHFLLGNHRQAHHFFRRRQEAGFPFRHPVTRRVFLEQFGRASFLAGEPEDARRSFAAAIEQAEGESADVGRRAWLWSALGASHQLAGDPAAAVEAFRRSCTLYGTLKQLARQEMCQRNLANNLLLAGKYDEAAAAFAEAERLLDRSRESDSASAGVSVAVSGRGSRAAFGFRKDQERHLLATLQSRLFWLQGEPWAALEAGERALDLLRQEMRQEGEETLGPDVARAASQQAQRWARAGEFARAASLARETAWLAEARDEAEGMAIAGINLASLAAQDGSGVTWQEAEQRLASFERRLAQASGTPGEDFRARFANARGVARFWAALSAATPVGAGDEESRLRRALAGLDHAVQEVNGAEASLAQACPAQDPPDRRRLLEAVLACDNLATLRAYLGDEESATALRRENERRAADFRLLSVAWRLSARPPEERAEMLLLLPADLAGTRTDPAARLMRDALLHSLGEAALAREDAALALEWFDGARLRARQDRLDAEDLALLSPRDAEALRQLGQAVERAQRALSRIEPAAPEEVRAGASAELDAALRQIGDLRAQAGASTPLWLLLGRAASAAQVRAALLPGEAMLFAAALPRRLVLFWITRDGLQDAILPVSASGFQQAVTQAQESDPARSQEARRRLEEWLLSSFRKEFPRTRTLLLAGDAADVALEPWEPAGSPSGPHPAVSRLGSASDLVRLRQQARFFYRVGQWRGDPPPAQVARTLAEQLGGLAIQSPRSAGEAPAAASDGAGVVIFADPVRGNPLRLLRPWVAGGGNPPRAGAESARASLWVLPMPRGDGAARDGLMATMLATGVPSALVLDGPVLGPASQGTLLGVLARLPNAGPAAALAGYLSSHAGAAPAGLPTGSVIGDPGLGAEERRARAEATLPVEIDRAMAAYGGRRWREAQDSFLQTRSLLRFLGRDELLPRVEQGLVQCAFNLEDFARARLHQLQIVELARRSGDAVALARAQALLGILETRLKNFEAAEGLLRGAAEALERQGLRAEAATAWNNLALAMDAAAKYPEALAAIRTAVGLYLAVGDRQSVLRLERNAGTIELRRRNDVSAARQRYFAAMEIARELSDRKQEAALALDLARCHLAAGDYAQALQEAARALEISKAQNDAAGQAAGMLEQAHAYWYQGDYPEAWAAQGRALELAAQAGDRRLSVMARSLGGLIALNLGDLAEAELRLGQALAEARQAQLPDEEATQLNNLGAVARQAGDTALARQRFEEALRLDEGRKNEAGRAYDLRNLGLLELSAGNVAVARRLLEEARHLSGAARDRFNLAKVLLGLADAQRVDPAGREAAQAHALEAERIATELGLKEITWRAQRVLGDLRASRGELEAALAQYREALRLVESMRAVAGGELQAGVSQEQIDLYDAAVQVLWRLGREDEALELAERARSRRLREVLSGRASRAGAEARLDTPDLPVSEMCRRIPADSALLYYFVGRERTLLWVLRPERRTLHVVPLSQQELARRIRALGEDLERFEPVEGELTRLYADVIGPAESDVTGVQRLGVVPHGELTRVPFAALRGADGQYLGERFDLFWLPSVGMMHTLANRAEERMGPAAQALVVGNPDVPGAPALPLAELEAEEVARELGSATLLVRQAARKQQVVERMADADVVHLACHGILDARNPLRSRLQLAPGSEGGGELSAREVFDLSLSARLVTLSACDSALGGGAPGDELAGLPRAFLFAGAENVVAGLWRVADPATAMLMKRLYRELAHQPPARALRRAQQTVRRYFPHPGHWAGFALFGLGR